MQRLSQSFQARLHVFEQIRRLIDEFASLASLVREDRHKLTLIVEELFTNTVTHGHKGDSDAAVTITLEGNKGDVELIYEDAAPPFNPLVAGQRTDIDSTIKERRVGGLGIFITIGLTQKVDYSYVEGHNRIHLKLCTVVS
jgi:anti-sigma regulatory factor (Ser/Thr protein kinase)